MSIKLINHLYQRHVHGIPNDRSALKRVIVDQKCKLIYNRIRKNANTYVTNIIYNQAVHSPDNNGEGEKFGQAAKRATPNLANTLVTDDLKKYRSLLIIRNPEIRVLSAFLQKFSTDIYRQKFGAFELDRKGFERFLRWLEDGNLNSDQHWDLQTVEMAFDLDFYTDIVRFEELNAVLPEIFSELGYDTTVMKRDELVSRSRSHKTDSDDRSKEFITEETRNRIRQLYASDFECFGGYY